MKVNTFFVNSATRMMLNDSSHLLAPLWCISISHHSGPVDVREKLAQQIAVIKDYLGQELPYCAEWVTIATCNRLEIYGLTEPADALPTAVGELLDWLGRLLGMEGRLAMLPLVRVFHADAAANHLCRVVSGLDSYVLGDNQIQGQVSSAFLQAVEDNTTGPLLSALFRTAIRIGKLGRTTTPIGAHAASIGSLAVSHAEAFTGDLAQQHVLVIGAGEMGRATLTALRSRRVKHVTVINRTLARAQAVVQGTEWKACGWDSIDDLLLKSDIVITAVSSELPILLCKQVKQVVTSRQSCCATTAPLLLIDLALPRNVDPAVRSLPGIQLVDTDQLQRELDLTISQRRSAIPAVETIIATELNRFNAEVRELQLRPLVVDLRTKAESIRRQELQRTLRFIGKVDAATEAHIEHLSHALVNKLLHEPTLKIKQMARSNKHGDYEQAVRDLFGLHSEFDTPSGSVENSKEESN
jgi:glutamyl-tRNA reductase